MRQGFKSMANIELILIVQKILRPNLSKSLDKCILLSESFMQLLGWFQPC